MRNTLVGAVLAVVLIAALFTAAHFGARPGMRPVVPPPALSPEQTAARLSPDFVGAEAIGAWHLVCIKPHTLSRLRQTNGGATGNSQGTPPRTPAPPPDWRVPRCRATIGLRNPQKPDQTIRLSFRLLGVQRVLAMFLRLPPSQVQNGDPMTLKLDSTELSLPVRGCTEEFCLALQSIKAAAEPPVVSSKTAMLVFTPSGSRETIGVAIPTAGLAPAVAALHRIDR